MGAVAALDSGGRESAAPVAVEGAATGPAPGTKTRLTSLDAFRGLTILGMLLVNNIALDTATPRQFLHAGWNEGLHFADLVFPWFVLIVGVSIAFSATSTRSKALPGWKYDLKVLTRALILFLLGCLIDSSLARRPVLGLGVLQLIGLAYLVGALLYGLPAERRALIAVLVLVLHWAAIRFIPIPGESAGVFTESRNLIVHLNSQYLEPVHLRGVISVVPTSALVLIGTLLGDLLRTERLPASRKITVLIAGGLGLAVVGWLWNFDIPFNKPLWTGSYVLFSAGCGAVLLGALHLAMDVTGWRALGFPFVVFGSNAIVAYVVPILTKAFILQAWSWRMADGSLANLQDAFLRFCIDHAGRIPGGWLCTLAYILAWWLVLLALYRKRVFVRA